MSDVSFGEWLKRRRKAQGLTQEQLALQLSCSTSALRKIEAEERRPSAQTARRLAELFHIPPDEQGAFQSFARGDEPAHSFKGIEDAPWRGSAPPPRSNLPSTTTRLIGRERDTAVVRGYLSTADIRLITLIGPPGIGKTRLSLAAAGEALAGFPDGVFFIALAPLDDAALVAPAIVQTLGYMEGGNRPALRQLVDGIGDKQLLLVLDNFEHIVEGAAPLAPELLAACPRLKLLVTSREALRVPGEWLYSVPPLETPNEGSPVDMETAAQYPALALFVERARAVRSDFALDAGNIQSVVSICSRLDALPLAIELIAARIRLMSPQALLERLTDAFVLSADGMRAASLRQKTLHNAIAWSYDLLPLPERELFARLSVFAGGFTLNAAESIFSRTLQDRSVADLVALLLDKSLLQRTLDARGEPRYNMLATIRQFALTCLRRQGDEAEARSGHLAYFLDLAERADQEIHGPNQIEWGDRLESERDNFHAALDGCVTGQKTEAALRLLAALCWSWDLRNHYNEMDAWFEKIRALPQAAEHPALYARLLTEMAQHDWMVGNFREAQSLLDESRTICIRLGEAGERALARTLDWSGMVARWSKGDHDAARALFERSFALHQKYGDARGMAESMFHLAIVEGDRNVDSALALLEQSLTRFRELGDLWSITRTAQILGQLFLKQGNYEKARQFFDQHLAIDEKLQFREGIVVALRDFGNLCRYQGEYDQAEQFYEKSLAICRVYGLKDDTSKALYFSGLLALHRNDYSPAARYFIDQFELARTVYEKIGACDLLIGLAAVAGGTRQPERAARLHGAAQALSVSTGYGPAPFDQAEFERHIQNARDQLGDEAFAALHASGRAMTTEQAVAYALGSDARAPVDAHK